MISHKQIQKKLFLATFSLLISAFVFSNISCNQANQIDKDKTYIDNVNLIESNQNSQIENSFSNNFLSKTNSENRNLIENISSESSGIKSHSNLSDKETSNFDILIESLKKSTKNYLKDLIEYCKKEKCEKKLSEFLKGKGFESYLASGQMKVSKGISGIFLEKYISNFIKMIKAPENIQTLIAPVLAEIELSERLIWNNFKLIFDVGNNKEAKFVSVFAFKRELENNTQKYDFVYLDFIINFNLEPDTLIISNSNLTEQEKKWSESEFVFSNIGKDLAWSDVKNIFNYFSVVAFKSLANYFNVKLDLNLEELDK